MSAGLSIDARDAVSPALARLTEGLTNPVRLNKKIGGDVLALVRNYLVQVAEERHASAEALGAVPTNFWGNPKSYTDLIADSGNCVVSIHHVGIGRVAHDVTITPKSGEWLTIPIARAAYGQRSYRMEGLFFVQPKGKSHALLGRRTSNPYNRDDAQDATEAQVEWMYLLVHSVHQKQDRTLLPPDEAIFATAEIAAAEFVDAALAARAGGNN